MSQVSDNAASQHFELAAGGEVAFIAYRRDGNRVELIHTEVPQALEGKGVGSALVRGTLEQLRAEGATVLPTCSFVARYIERHSEYGDMVAGG
ncbi:N-acetyltransferase [Belnapia sp. T18]|uniref:N-acetyltransferase n=1 Tax=Belnapia arida TaxID=2804533 RepID=A0ABS1TWT2_9PROT|nr:GNAT family N-acetyltransferase [Belnapia arida]MBL6076887.1 N-acetyltransferase [Belnapia arida]